MLKWKKNISLNLSYYADETPYRVYTSRQTFEKHIDILLLSNSKNLHYDLIKDFDRFMTKKTKHLAEKFLSILIKCFPS